MPGTLFATTLLALMAQTARTPLPKTPVTVPTNLHDLEHQLAVKFVDAAKVRAPAGGALVSLSGTDLAAVRRIANAEGIRFRRLIQLPDATLAALEQRGETLSGTMQPDLAGMVLVLGLADEEAMVRVGNQLQNLPVVEFASMEAVLPPPPGDYSPNTPDLTAQQNYRGPDPGIDADFAWTLGARGQGIRLSDCEYGWVEDHEDLVDVFLHLEPGQTPHPDVENLGWDEHGTAVIGETSAIVNAYGCTGMVPDADVYTFPEWTVEEGFRRATCIANAIAGSQAGDVVLLEMQNGSGAPAEIDATVWTIVKAGSDADVIVVGAAGNGNVDLDGAAYSSYRARGDSGAIIVGAGSSNRRHDKLSFSTYGSRVNVQGWGENVFTLGYGDYAQYGGDKLQRFTSRFSGTSSASPFVTSACVALQSYAEQHVGARLKPVQMRRLLERTGIPQGSGGHIGPFPDMRAALGDLAGAVHFNLEPRSALGATGEETIDITVQSISANALPGTGLLHYDDGSGWQSVPMNDRAAGAYVAVFPPLPGADCGLTVHYYLSVGADDGQTYTHPVNAPAFFHTATAWPITTTVADLDFESDAGWTVEDTNVLSGSWERAVPSAGGDQADPLTDYDGSGACWVTGNTPGADVDGGPTHLLSPAYDLSGLDQATLSYARWVSGDGKRRLRAQLSDDGGTSWVEIEDPQKEPGWHVREFNVQDFVLLTDQVRIRFEIKDDPDRAIHEAAIDRFRLTGTRCALALAAAPPSTPVTGPFSFTTWPGTPSGLALLFVTEIDSTPTFTRIAVGTFAGDQTWTLAGNVPNDPGLSGLDLRLQSFGFGVSGQLESTAKEAFFIE